MTKEKAVETKQVKLVNKSSFNVQMPVASVTEENSSATGTPVSSTDTTYLGNHDIHLSSNTGSAIYYTLTTTVDGGTPDTSSLQLYQQKIPLSACELKTTKYEITTYAMAFGQKSESQTYTYTIHNDRYVLTTITRDTDGKDVKELHTYSVGDTVSINANAPANKTFASWKITSDSSKEEKCG